MPPLYAYAAFLAPRLYESCNECLPKPLLDLLTDPYTHKLLKPLREDRRSLIKVHVHQPTAMDAHHNGETAYKFLMVYRDRRGAYRLLFTLSAATLEGAVENAWHTIKKTGRFT